MKTLEQLATNARPDPACQAQRISAIITLLQAAQGALSEDQPGTIQRVGATLTAVLSTLNLLRMECESAAERANSTQS